MDDPKRIPKLNEVALERYPELAQMYAEFDNFAPVIMPSLYWEALNEKNLQQLADSRYQNFKRTVARNYFTWIVNPLNKQMRFLMAQAGILRSLRYLVAAIRAPRGRCTGSNDSCNRTVATTTRIEAASWRSRGPR